MVSLTNACKPKAVQLDFYSHIRPKLEVRSQFHHCSTSPFRPIPVRLHRRFHSPDGRIVISYSIGASSEEFFNGKKVEADILMDVKSQFESQNNPSFNTNDISTSPNSKESFGNTINTSFEDEELLTKMKTFSV